MKIILGSSSKTRKKVLQNAGYDFEVMVPDIDEKAIRSDDFEELPLLVARAKITALLPKIKEPAIVICSDTVVVCNGELREKPESKEEALKFLKSYEQYPAQTITAVVVANTATGKQAEGVDITKVYFKKFPQEVLDKIIAEEELPYAGAFAVNDPVFEEHIKKIEGSKNGAAGLPMKLTKELMEEVK